MVRPLAPGQYVSAEVLSPKMGLFGQGRRHYMIRMVPTPKIQTSHRQSVIAQCYYRVSRHPYPNRISVGRLVSNPELICVSRINVSI